MAIHTQTFTAEIENITPITAGVWRIVLKDGEAILTGVNPPATALGSGISDESNMLLNPFIDVRNIDYHPYNAILNNATNISNAAHLQEVDYSNGVIVPTNITQIRNNTAVKAEVSEYIHNAAGMVRGKYTGKQLKAAELSVFTEGDKSFGKSPVIYYNDKYFGYAPDLERTDPVLAGKTQYSLRYLVDDNGEVVDLTNISNKSQYIQQNFREGNLVNVRLQNPRITELGKNPNYYLTGDTRIHKSGERIELILTSESDYGVLMNTLRFQGTDSGIISNYSLTVPPNFTETTLTDSFTVVDFKAASRDEAGYWSAANDEYEFGADSNARVSFYFKGIFENTGNINKREAQARIVRDRGGIITEIASKTFELGVNDIDRVVLESSPEFFESGDKVYVQVKNIDYSGNRVKLRARGYPNSYISPIGVRVNIGSEEYTTLRTTQTPQSSTPLSTSGLFSNGTPNVLTGSLALNDYYEQSIQAHHSGSVYPTSSLHFTVEVGDEFRFSNGISGSAATSPASAEVEVYRVIDVEFVDRIYITLDKAIPSNVSIDGFVLRRYVKDPTSIILNQEKIEGDTSPAFILPQYAPEELESKLSNIIKDLVGQNLI